MTTLLTENIEAVLPDLPKMKEKIDNAVEEVEKTAVGGSKNYQIAIAARDAIEELKGEFEYMKTRFSPQFVQRVDKALSNLTTLAYDVEVVKMTASHAAMKKDLDLVEQRLQNYVLMPKFLELQHQCMDYADKKDIDRLDTEIEKTNQKMTKFVLKTDVSEKFKKVEKEIWEELSLKLEKKTFERKFDHFEQEQLNQEKQTKKEIASLREVIDRMRRKSEETTLAINELRQESDSKLSAKEGQKLWANFRKYAQYDELRELYRKTMPAIS